MNVDDLVVLPELAGVARAAEELACMHLHLSFIFKGPIPRASKYLQLPYHSLSSFPFPFQYLQLVVVLLQAITAISTAILSFESSPEIVLPAQICGKLSSPPFQSR